MKSLLFVRLYSLLQRQDSSGTVLPVQVMDMQLGAAGPVLGYPNRKQGECDSPGTVQGLEKDTGQSIRCPTILPTLQTDIFQLQNKMLPQSSMSVVLQIPGGLFISGSVCQVGSISCSMSEKASPAMQRSARHLLTLPFWKKKSAIFHFLNSVVAPQSPVSFSVMEGKKAFYKWSRESIFFSPLPCRVSEAEEKG